LLADHGYYAAARALYDDAQSSLHTDQSFKITTFFQLDHHLVSTAHLLHLVALCPVDVLYIVGKLFDIYFIRVVKARIHPTFLLAGASLE
jgi:hypothetical protein